MSDLIEASWIISRLNWTDSILFSVVSALLILIMELKRDRANVAGEESETAVGCRDHYTVDAGWTRYSTVFTPKITDKMHAGRRSFVFWCIELFITKIDETPPCSVKGIEVSEVVHVFTTDDVRIYIAS